MKKIFCLGFLLLLLTGCSLEEKLIINPDLSGEVNISFESLIENDEKIKENQEFINFLNKRLYAEISGILKILIPNLTEKIYKEFLEKQKQK